MSGVVEESVTEGVTETGLPVKLISMQGLAEYLDVSIFWVKDQVRHKKVDCTRVGKHVRFTPAQVADLVASLEQKKIRTRGNSRASR